MNKPLFKMFSIVTILALMLMALPMQSAGAAGVIVKWTFESPNTPADATNAAAYPNTIAPAVGTGNAGGVHASADTDWTTPAGNGSVDSLSSNTWAIGDYYQFTVSTLNFTDIHISWDQTRSSTGPSDFKLAYSTDGMTFTDFDSYTVPANTWSSGTPVSTSTFSRDLSTITVLDNQANVYFRLIAISAPTGTGGTNRVDNFSISSDPVAVEDIAPSVTATSPSNGATGVAVSTNITLTFSENVDLAAGAITLECPAGTVVASNTAADNVSSVVLDPASDLPFNTICVINVSASGVTDDDVNDPPDAMAANFSASFTTGAPMPLPGDVVISEVYGGGGNTGAPYTNDFIELYNRTANPIDLTGWSVQYASNTGTSWQVTPLTGSIDPGKYYLVQEAAGVNLATPLPSPDATGTIPMSGTAGKVALVQNSTALSGACPTGSHISDFVGYGTTANCFEGTGPTVAPSNTNSVQRLGNGATDTNNNNADFTAGTPVPQSGADTAPTVTSTTPASGSASVAVGSNIEVTFSEAVTATSSSFTVNCSTSGTHTITVSGGATTFTINPDTDFVAVETCTVTVVGTQVSDLDTDDPPDTLAADYVFSFSTEGPVCEQTFTPIYSIQGSGTAAAITGNVTTVGVVVGDFETTAGIQGFYIQDQTGDGDAATSDGILVFTGTANTVNAGDLVRVTGFAGERFGQTTINGSNSDTAAVPAANVVNCGTGSVTPIDVNLPFSSATDPERYEGMLVRFPQSLVIAEYFNYDQFGEIVLALPLEGESRPFTGTAIEEPGAEAIARNLANSLSRITLDDGRDGSNPTLLRHPNGDPFSLTNRFRGGDQVQNAVGVLGYGFNLYRIYPTALASYTSVNPRPAAPEEVGGSLRVAAMNTLNFFVTADYPTGDSRDNKCGPLNSVECRGWDSNQSQEFTRQRDKLLQALSGLDADVIGLNELENSTGVEPLQSIVDGLDGYAYINTGTIGTDAIKVGMIYRPAVVTPVGDFKLLTSAVDPDFVDTKSRPSLAQTFEVNATGARFTMVVNHLKSKGSDCNDLGDPDEGDGQGNCNETRTKAAQALVDWLATDPTGSGDPDFIIMGDLNSYAMEDPITAIKLGADDTAGTDDDYTNLIAQFQGKYAYSYTFDGQAGYLDHALANQSLLSQVTGATEWHINSDEPDVLDYDTSFKPNSQDALYEPNQFRTSDHDPVIVGLDLDVPNNAPTVDAGGPYAVVEGGTVLVSATGSDPDAGDTLTYAWDLDNNGSFETPGQSVTFDATSLTAPATYTIGVQVTDAGGLTATDTATVTVIYNFTGFFQPVDNLPVVNTVKAGQAIPIKFSLNGDQGLDIFAAGSPKFEFTSCSAAPGDAVEETLANSNSSLTYDAASDLYTYVWKTDKKWAGKCGTLYVTLNDGTTHTALFKFNK